eukprot:14443350-Ditylum_brightwellii.AAC.1
MPNKCPVIVDTGASCGITPFALDFIGPLQPSILFIHRLNRKLEVKGFGMAKRAVKDAKTGSVVTIIAPAYHVQSAEIRLLSPQQYFQHAGGGTLVLEKDSCNLTMVSGQQIEIHFFADNLPAFPPHTTVDVMANVASALDAVPDVLFPKNVNLSHP